MTTENRRDSQAESDNHSQELTIAEKAAIEYFETDLSNRVFEPSTIVSMVHTIIGSNKPLNSQTPITPVDDLARLLVGLVREKAFSESTSLSVKDAIECCFLHSSVYQLALRLYYLDQQGKLRGPINAHEALQEVIDQALVGEHPEVVRANDSVKSNMQMPESAPLGWAQQFGNMIASLYGDNLTKLTHNELCDAIMQIANEGNTFQAEAQRLLPLGLNHIFDAPPIIRISLHPGDESLSLCEITEGDLVKNAESLIKGINEICRPFDIPDFAPKDPSLVYELIGQNGVEADLYSQFLPVEAFKPFADFIKQTFGIEVSMPEVELTSNPAEKPVQTVEAKPAQSEPASDVQSVIRANRFELIDEDGNVAAELETMRGIMGQGRRTIFSMEGNEGRNIQMVSDTQTGEMAFNILEDATFYPVRFGVGLRPGDTRPTLEIGGMDKHKAAYMRLTVDDNLESPEIVLYDRKDNARAVLKVLRDGTPIFKTYEPKAKKKKEVKPDSTQTVYRLSEYEDLRLSLYRPEYVEEAFSIHFSRHDSEMPDAFITVGGVNPITYNIEKLNIPLLSEDKGKFKEDIALSNKGEMLFLGHNDAKVFGLRWLTPKADPELSVKFEAILDTYNEAGECVRSLMIYE